MRIISAITMLVSLAALVVGCLSLALNSLEPYVVPLFSILSFVLIAFFIVVLRFRREAKLPLLILAVLALFSTGIPSFLPEYLQGLGINGIIHRSLFSAILLIVIAIPAAGYSLYYLLGATPRAYDASKYPLLLFPIVMGIAAYALIIGNLIIDGAPRLSWSLLTNPFLAQYSTSVIWEDGWPRFVSEFISQVGMRNHILGTFMLMLLTSAISLPIGIGVGIFRHQYAGPRMAGIIGFSTTALRSISGIILAITAVNLARGVNQGSFLGYIVHGFGYNVDGILVEGRGSFLFAAIFISLLVIPLIARATEEGLRSLPQDIWEGSLGLGASREYTLLHIMLPWSLPNIITGLVLGCAEAAGALTVIFLIAGTGEYGIGPLNEVTSLAYLIFDCKYGKELGDQVQTIMGSYQYTAALLLLLVTLGLTATAMVLKNKTSRRYKGI